MRDILLSLDFDFFVREDPTWDWGHREAVFFRETMWVPRYFGFPGDLYAEMAPENHADCLPAQLKGELEARGLQFGRKPLVFVSDSHCFASSTFREVVELWEDNLQDPLLLHLDAHHDLGYNDAVVQKARQEGVSHCDNWLIQLVADMGLPTRLVYPRWRECEANQEWDSVHRLYEHGSWAEEALSRVSRQVGLDGVPQGNVRLIHICRSGSWVPPWLDPMFIEMVRTFGLPSTPYTKDERCNPMEPREWNPEEMEVLKLRTYALYKGTPQQVMEHLAGEPRVDNKS